MLVNFGLLDPGVTGFILRVITANAYWKDKSLNYFFPKLFNLNASMKHGISEEENARKTYVEKMKLDVCQFGLIVPNENQWLGYSPDGIVFENGKPVKLVEIKCPNVGKNKTVHDILKDLKFINIPEMNLKKKHPYYGQVQLGMAILNLEITDFVIYSSFDKSFEIIPVKLDFEFVDMLKMLKNTYFCKMLYFVCIEKGLANQ